MFRLKIWLIILVIYLLSALVYTFPLVLVIDRYLIGQGGLDGFQYIWNLFSFWYQISHLQSPFTNQLLFYPIGVNLLFSDYSAFSSLIGLPFLKSPVLYMNLLVIGGVTLSSFLTYFLCYHLTQNRLSSLLAGFIYGFSTSIGSNIYVQHNYYLIGAAFLPMVIYLLIRFLESGNHFLRRLIIVELLLLFTNYYFFILSGLMVVTLIISCLVADRKLRTSIINHKNFGYYKKTVLFAAGLFLSVASLIYLQSNNLEGWIGSKSNYAAICNANLAGLLIPSQSSSISSFSVTLYQQVGLTENGDTPFYYLGIVFLLCAISSLFYYRKNTFILPLLICGVVVLLFSLGLVVRFGEIDIIGDKLTPFYWLTRLPLLGMVDCPIRFVMGVHLIIAILVSYFITFVGEKKRWLGGILLVICFFSLFIDYSVEKFPLTAVEVPRVYRYLAKSENNETVLELPSGLTESKGGYGYDWAIPGLHTRQLYWQTIHQKPRIGGYVSRIPESTYSFYRSEKIISDIFDLTSLNGSWNGRQFSRQEKKQFIDRFNLGYIIVVPEPRQQEFILVVEEVLSGLNYEKYEFDGYVLYEINDHQL